MRPGEGFAWRWSHVLIGEDGTGLIRVVEGKSKAARRILPMTPVVHALLKLAMRLRDARLTDGYSLKSRIKAI